MRFPHDTATMADTPVSHFETAEIEAVIDHYDDPSHPDALDVETARAHLLDVQRAFDRGWDDRMEAVRSGSLPVAADLGEVVVLHDPDRRVWDGLLDELQVYDGVARTVLRVVHHQAGTRLLDRSFDGTDPVVVEKPDRAAAGQLFVESVLAALTDRGLSAAEAWAYYGIEIKRRSPEAWLAYAPAEDRIELADAVERARDKLG